MIVIAVTFVLAAAIIIGWDSYLGLTKGFDATLSYWMLTNSVQFPIIPLAFGLVFGVLAGHFWWDQVLNVTVCPGLTSQ